jgi:hypothetical protein
MKIVMKWQHGINKWQERFVIETTQHDYQRCPGIQYTRLWDKNSNNYNYVPYVWNKRMKKWYK